jgi:pimeloyl-ACP methyl ester carboxylesterase
VKAVTIIERDGLELRGYDCGAGSAVVFQHGLGGDEAQVAEAFPASEFRRLTLECRGHGASEAGERFSIPIFADDVLAYADACSVESFAIGGISMGAAIALRIAVIAPGRVSALILARPAWNWEMAPANMQAFAVLSHYLATGDRAGFEASEIARNFAVHAPDNLASLRKFFDRPEPANTARLLAAIAGDGPQIAKAQVRAIRVPTLVIGNAVDLVHPLAQARILAEAIPDAQFVEIAPKATDKSRHLVEFQACVTRFLQHRG